jgi:hypothetical protein
MVLTINLVIFAVLITAHGILWISCRRSLG